MKGLLDRLLRWLRGPIGRVATVSAGVAAVVYIVAQLGFDAVARALAAGARLFPLVLLLELPAIVCTMLALRSLYGPPGRAIPLAALARGGLVGYATMGLLPAGRALAEVARAAMLARWVGSARAAGGAIRMQGVALLGNAVVSLPATVATYLAVGTHWLTVAIALNGLAVLLLGGTLIVVGHKPNVGEWIGRRVARERYVHAPSPGEQGPWLVPVLWESLGRAFQVLQNAVLIVAVGGPLSLGLALCSEGIHLVGAAVGEMVPAQLGFLEANYTLAAGALALPAASAVSIALLAHLSQLVWVLVGVFVLLGSPARSTPAAPAAAAPAAPTDATIT